MDTPDQLDTSTPNPMGLTASRTSPLTTSGDSTVDVGTEPVWFQLQPKRDDPPLFPEDGHYEMITTFHTEIGNKFTFKSEQWLRYFSKYTSREFCNATFNKTEYHHSIRLAIQFGTFTAFDKSGYFLEDGRVMALNNSLFSQACDKTWQYLEPPPLNTPSPGHSTIVEVIEGDCLDVARALLKAGHKTSCLNMANAYTPGGGYMHGNGAQEENIHRRSCIFLSLEARRTVHGKRQKNYYPLAEGGGLYSQDVLVIRENEAKGYQFLEEPYLMNFVTCAALNRPPLSQTPEGFSEMVPHATETMLRKMEAIICMAIKHGDTALVLSAFGCGAFRCPPRHVAALFKQVLEKYSGYFQRVAFAIFNDHNARGDGNVKPFATIFGVESQLYEDWEPTPKTN